MIDIDNLSMLPRLPGGVFVKLSAVATINPEVMGPDEYGAYTVQIGLDNGTYHNATFYDKEEATKWTHEFAHAVNSTLVLYI